MKTLEVRTTRQWHAWLKKHHDTESEVWLVFFKQHTGRPSIDYEEAVEEALCFGWIDSLVKRLDDERFARKFTPRKTNSWWSDLNRARYARMKAAGRLMPAGFDRSPNANPPRPRRPVPAETPADVERAMKKNAAALAHYRKLPEKLREKYARWVYSAKHQETRARRLDEVMRLLAAGKRLGLK